MNETCDACGDAIVRRTPSSSLNVNRVRVGKVNLTLCYYCSHDIHSQLSLGVLWIRMKKPKDIKVTNNMLGDGEYGHATVFDGGKMIFHQE